MEVAGLALGVVGVVGVIGAFKDAIELFSLIADSRHLGRDYEVLETKLDIEKTLLLQWAHRVKLLRPDYDRRLDDPHTQALVVRIFKCIEDLFNDAPELIQRYGLHETPEKKPGVRDRYDLVSRAPQVSDSRWENFLVEYRAFRQQDGHKKPSAPLIKRARWMVRDKQKFEDLVQELAHFTAKINEVVPVAVNDTYTRSMTDQDVETIRDLRKLKILMEASAGSRKMIAESTQHAITEACKDRILARLWFRRIDDRRENIAAAHCNTLQWALNSTTQSVPWDDLPEWLRSGSGIYWISGKAGSGKSTLMKHIYLDDHVQTLLSQWAQGGPYYLCNFFFMNLGTMEQKSQDGLSRTLLYQILSTHRDLIPEALPYLWKEMHAEGKDTEDNIELPSRAETKLAFSHIAKSCEKIGRFCFFIDGLDEFVGDYMDGIAFIKSLVENIHIKIVVSSRPISDCVAAFVGLPQLQLQDLNRRDITTYVKDVIGKHSCMMALMWGNADGYRLIIKDIIDKSSGVFLWVVLACRALLGGFADGDHIAELRRRVDELPPELEDMFQHMLSKIKKHHREQGARLLRTFYTQQTPPWPNTRKHMRALGLAMVDDYHISPIAVRRYRDEAKQNMCEVLKDRLRSRCGGLLELTPGGSCFCNMEAGEHNRHIHQEVRFMHRTVFEFLNDDKTWDLECLQLPQNDKYDVATALSLYGLHLAIQSLNSADSQDTQASSFLWEGLRWAVIADSQPSGKSESYFESLPLFFRDQCFDETASHDESLKQISSRAAKAVADPDCYLSLQIAIEAGAVNYVRKHPSLRALAKHDRCQCECWPILFHAVHKVILSQSFQTTKLSKLEGAYFASPDMLNLLLRQGFNPNELFPAVSHTPWSFWLQHQGLKPFNFNDYGKMKLLVLLEIFARSGADPTPGRFSLCDFVTMWYLGNDSSEQVREKGRAVLQLIQELNTRAAAPSFRSRLLQSRSMLAVVGESDAVSGLEIPKRKAKIRLFSSARENLSVRVKPISNLWRKSIAWGNRYRKASFIKLEARHSSKSLANVVVPASSKRVLLVVSPQSVESIVFDNSTCVLSPEGEDGPYYVKGEYIRSNISESQPGISVIWDLQFININTCSPITNLTSDIWHCNTNGVYAGVLANGNDDSSDTSNIDTTFLRGLQTTDEDGVVQYTSIFPGYYSGKATHVHVETHLNGTALPNRTYSGGNVAHIGQFFCDQDLITSVNALSPYFENSKYDYGEHG